MNADDISVAAMLVAAILLAVGEIREDRAIRLLAIPILLAECARVMIGLAMTGVPTG